MAHKKLRTTAFLMCIISICTAQEIIPYELFPERYIVEDDLKPETVFITTEDGYLALKFRDLESADPVDTVPHINFTQKILVRHRYRGSNCDNDHRLRIEKRNQDYHMYFAVGHQHVCRDLAVRRIWFIIDKPREPFGFSVERVSLRELQAVNRDR